MQRGFKTPKGTELPLMDIKGKPYLSVQHRIMWFREDKPLWTIETHIERTSPTSCQARCRILDENGRLICTGTKVEDVKGFPDFIEKAESGSIGRALGFLGYGTQFALDLEEGNRLADAPTNEKKSYSPPKVGSQALNSSSIPSWKTTSGISLPPKDEAPWPPEEERMVVVNKNKDPNLNPENYRIEFGKFKGRSIREVISEEGAEKLQNYIKWLQQQGASKPLQQNAHDFIEAAEYAIELENERIRLQVHQDKNLPDKLNRLNNEFVLGIDPDEEIPF